MTPQKVIEFVQKHTKEDGDCLIWTGRLSCSSGHPKMGNQTARRAYYVATKGPIKRGNLITTACGHRLCMAHLAQVTRSEVSRKLNADPSIKARKRASSAKASRAKGKINMDIARQIRESSDTIDVEAAKHGIDRSLVHKIRTHEAWREDILQASPFSGLFTGLVAANEGRKRA